MHGKAGEYKLNEMWSCLFIWSSFSSHWVFMVVWLNMTILFRRCNFFSTLKMGGLWSSLVAQELLFKFSTFFVIWDWSLFVLVEEKKKALMVEQYPLLLQPYPRIFAWLAWQIKENSRPLLSSLRQGCRLRFGKVRMYIALTLGKNTGGFKICIKDSLRNVWR